MPRPLERGDAPAGAACADLVMASLRLRNDLCLSGSYITRPPHYNFIYDDIYLIRPRWMGAICLMQ